MKKIKIGRNKPCPCGSGKKYKKCCGFTSNPLSFVGSQERSKKNLEIITLEKQRFRQQGLGRPIISGILGEYRNICVGDKMYSSKGWKTFHDFLFDYIKQLFGSNWGNSELSKSIEERHPLLKIYDLVCRQQKKLAEKSNENGIFSGSMPGAISFYLWLSYNLYLIEHNKEIQNKLIARLKHPDQFSGACYETFVTAMFLRAGFLIEFEDETSRKSTHCEFTATHKITGKKYGVEVKQRNRISIISNNKGSNKLKLDYKGLGKLLNDALQKDTDYERIIFIDVNLPSSILNKDNPQELRKKLINFIKDKEKKLEKAPPAYVFLTNYPYHYKQDLEAINHYIFVLSEGFKVNDFGFKVTTLRQAINSRTKHQPIDDLFNAIKRYTNIPSTFDGSIPEFTYGKVFGRLKIGETYKIPDKSGNFFDGKLTECCVVGEKAYGALKTTTGTLLVSFELSDAEMAAYQKHPDTFFGVCRGKTKRAEIPLDLYDFLYDSYQDLPKEDILLRLQKHPDLSSLKSLTQNELLSIYCEELVYSCWEKNGPQK